VASDLLVILYSAGAIQKFRLLLAAFGDLRVLKPGLAVAAQRLTMELLPSLPEIAVDNLTRCFATVGLSFRSVPARLYWSPFCTGGNYR